MRKIKALMKNELINFKRSKLAWAMGILYVLGMAFSIYIDIKQSGNDFILSEFIKSSWIPLNFIMIPFLIFSMHIGKSFNSIFDSTDISYKEKKLAKILSVGFIGLIIVIFNSIVCIIFGIICKVSINYFFYQFFGYIINTFVTLIALGAIGLFIGEIITKKASEVLSFILIMGLFILLCNFYKFKNFITPLYYIRQFPSNFDIFNYDKSYFYHNILWVVLSYMIIKITFYKENKNEKRKFIISLSTFIASFILSIFLIINLHSLLPDLFLPGKKMSEPLGSKLMEKNDTFRNEEEKKYYAYKYKMNIELDSNLKNSCEITIKTLQDKINSLEIGLFNKLNITGIYVDNTKLDYTRTNNSVVINLLKEYKKDDIINLKIDYEGNINTVWGNKIRDEISTQYQQLFYVKKNLIALDGTFEWYPKQNDTREKEYILNIKYNSKNKLFSNLEGSFSKGEYKFQGNDKEIVLVSGGLIKEREYKGNTFIGNEEYINNDEICEALLSSKERSNLKDAKKIIHVPLCYYSDECYEKVLVNGFFDK